MKARLVDYLACPKCKSHLQCTILQEDSRLAWSEIIKGHLTCEACGEEYAIMDGVPRMIAGYLPHQVEKTVDRFGWQWQQFNKAIKDTYMAEKAHFLDFIYPITEDYFVGKIVLDAGCGMGRFLKLGAEFGSRDIIGIDLSSSVDAAYANTRYLPNAHVVQADILNLPFAINFDHIFSIGVLHHLSDPKEGFRGLTKLLTKEGGISAWVYSRENNGWLIFGFNPIRKYLTSRLPKPLLRLICYLLGIPLYTSLKLVYKPANEGKLGFITGRMLPYNEYLHYTSQLTYTSLVSVIFDHLAPQLTEYISREEFEGWFQSEDLNSITITARNNMSWRGFGTRSNNGVIESGVGALEGIR